MYVYNIHFLRMIKSIIHKGLELFWTKGDNSKLPAEQSHNLQKLLNVINYLEDVLKDLEVLRNLRPHLLKGGSLKGFWSINVSGNYRLVF